MQESLHLGQFQTQTEEGRMGEWHGAASGERLSEGITRVVQVFRRAFY